MVGIVLVSHSRPLAMATQELVRAMTGPGLSLAVAAGAGENHAELGTDAVEISEAIRAVQAGDGVLVLMDMGSAILSSETALDLMDEKDRRNVRFCPAPFVEGAVAAGVTANLGASLDDVFAEAIGALKQKGNALHVEPAVAVAPSDDGKTIPASSEARVLRLTVCNVHGLHARPAACLIGGVKSFQSKITVRNMSNRRGPVSVKSLSALASLEILQDHEIEVSAAGPDAEAALQKIGELAEGGFGEAVPAGRQGASPAGVAPARASKAPSEPVPISDGLAIGPVFYLRAATFDVPQNQIEDIAAETKRLNDAVAATGNALVQRRGEMAGRVGDANAGIYDAQILALQDPELIGHAQRLISDEHKNAAVAWSEANRQIVDRYAALQDTYLRERAADIADVGLQVLERLGVKVSNSAQPAEPSILIADDLTPRQVAALSRNMTLGVILLDGGPTAHSSILLKALGLPALIQARGALVNLDRAQPRLVAFDGATGKIWLDPAPDFVADLKKRQSQEGERVRREKEASAQPGATADGNRIEIFANVGEIGDAKGAIELGAEGIGLLRTEFLFLNREEAPTEDEQVQALDEIAEQFEEKPVIVRTLDIGGDKEVAYLRMAKEVNPFLGVRALRLCFRREDLFETQLRAILRAAHGRDFKIMFPMVADIGDLARARASLEKAHADLAAKNIPHRWPIEAGIMVEIPSAALQADVLAEQADFFSIGTNDLTQYALAADRGNPDLGLYQDPLHPGVLRLIEMIVGAARKRERPVAVCGEAASDESAALVLVGLGVTELSATAGKIPRLKAALRTHSMKALQQLAASALECRSAGEVRALASRQLASGAR
jgi:phosphocarrier protein FPr